MIILKPVYKEHSKLTKKIEPTDEDTIGSWKRKMKDLIEHGKGLALMGIPFVVVNGADEFVSGKRWIENLNPSN